MNRTGYYSSIVVFVLISQVALAGHMDPEMVVVAGSSLESPPPFWEDSFWGITRSIDRAFPFYVEPLGPYDVVELQVPAYHYDGMAGGSADFSIHIDDSGVPGAEIALFQISGISTNQTIRSTSLAKPVLLNSGERYWIIASTVSGQVNWNLGDFTFGEAAYRVNDGPWEFLDRANVSGFALLGTPVPEPSTLLLLALSGFAMHLRDRQHGSLTRSPSVPHPFPAGKEWGTRFLG